jgi:hypothetical protein
MLPDTRLDNAPLTVPATTTPVSSNSATDPINTKDSRLRTLRIGRSGISDRRRATRRNPPATAMPIISTRNSQPIGDLLNACRLLKMPLRVRNVAKLHQPKLAMARASAVFFSTP